VTPSALIFDIQRFCLHDGPGIRTTVFFKGCPLACAWCQNPEALSPRPEMAYYAERCLDCGLCARACPEGAIRPRREGRLDFTRCSHCGQCIPTCDGGALRLIGRAWRLPDLLEELLRDREFFAASGGGVTFSGGEPLLQADVLAAALPTLKSQGLHVQLETSGAAPWERWAHLLPRLDGIYFDLKHPDPEAHRRGTGRDNRLILENYSRLAEVFPAVEARMPVVPGFNTDPDALAALARFLKACGTPRIHLLPYHRLGEAKLPRLDTRLKPLGIAAPGEAEMSAARAIFQREGVDAICYER
jgi:pyruvate formate lyase activating enzyme